MNIQSEIQAEIARQVGQMMMDMIAAQITNRCLSERVSVLERDLNEDSPVASANKDT